MIRSVFKGSGSALPVKCMSNDELAELVDTSDEWIRERTGIAMRYLAGGDPRVRQRSARGGGGERAGGFPLAGHVAHGDPGALANPFVAGVDEPGQLVVGHALGRKRRAGALEHGADQLAAPTTPFSRSL